MPLCQQTLTWAEGGASGGNRRHATTSVYHVRVLGSVLFHSHVEVDCAIIEVSWNFHLESHKAICVVDLTQRFQILALSNLEEHPLLRHLQLPWRQRQQQLPTCPKNRVSSLPVRHSSDTSSRKPLVGDNQTSPILVNSTLLFAHM
jgi:hypothetical protein